MFGSCRPIPADAAESCEHFVSKVAADRRLATPDRLQPKGAGDVYRRFDAAAPADMAAGG
jgi:hypothetical protein